MGGGEGDVERTLLVRGECALEHEPLAVEDEELVDGDGGGDDGDGDHVELVNGHHGGAGAVRGGVGQGGGDLVTSEVNMRTMATMRKRSQASS